MTPEQELWQSVVYEAVNDATAPDPAGKENRLAKEGAHNWLTRNGKDFRFVCMLAGMDPDFVSEAYTNGRVNRDMLKNKRIKARIKVAALAGGE